LGYQLHLAGTTILVEYFQETAQSRQAKESDEEWQHPGECSKRIGGRQVLKKLDTHNHQNEARGRQRPDNPQLQYQARAIFFVKLWVFTEMLPHAKLFLGLSLVRPQKTPLRNGLPPAHTFKASVHASTSFVFGQILELCVDDVLVQFTTNALPLLLHWTCRSFRTPALPATEQIA
jgi:hypothetical protein